MLPGQPALESGIQARSDQLIKFNRDVSSALAQITREMGVIRNPATSTSTVVDSLASQVTTLSNLVDQVNALRVGAARLHHPTAPEAPPILPPARPAAPVPSIPQREPSVSRAKPNPPFPERYSGDPDKCLGFLKECRDYAHAYPSSSLTDGTPREAHRSFDSLTVPS